MEKYVGMRDLVEIIFDKESTVLELEDERSSIPSNYLNEDFKQKIGAILYCKKVIINYRFKEFILGHIRKALLSNEEYLKYVMSLCLREYDENRNIFDSFIGACAFVQYVSEQTLRKTEVNFTEMDSDIFIIFYRNVLRSAFLEKGFSRFWKYIRTHEYLKWENKTNGFTFISGHSEIPTIEANLHQEIRAKSNRYSYFKTLPIETKSSEKVNMKCVTEVFLNTRVKFPALPSEPDLIRRMVEIKKREMTHGAEAEKTFGKKKMSSEAEVTRTKTALIKEISDGNSSLNPDAETNCLAKQQENIARHENIIQAVIRHNLKNKTDEDANNRISKEADGILDHLKSTIKSLTEVLDKCDKE